ncbi:MAG: biliverdin-producing heme oxygenase [Acetobacterales bacterium]
MPREQPAAPPPLFAALRARTEAAHRRLEATPRLRRLLSDDYGRGEYVALLARFAGFFGPLEDRLLAPDRDAARRCGYRPRMPALSADLRAFGATDDRVQAAAVPAPEGTAAEIGCLYVLEGSRLGGTQIARRLGETLGLTPEHGLRFFSGDTAPGRGWKAFRHRAAALSDDADRAVAAASQTFALLQHHLEA